jgi:retron-type reverse transcriptase
MKRHGSLYEKVTNYQNLQLSHINARKGKGHYLEVKRVNTDTEKMLRSLQESLIDQTFHTAKYATKRIYEPKERLIYKLPYYPDRIVHHAVMNVIQPIWDKVFIQDLYSAIPGKGLHQGSFRLRQFLKDKDTTRFCLKFDIQKYYPSIDHDILLDLIQRKIKCRKTLWLLEDIVRSAGGSKNAPIGNYLSQYFGNIYLNWFDHWIKEDLGRKHYIRYCDDGIILGSSRQELNGLCDQVNEYLKDRLDLTLNKKTMVIEVDKTGIDFLGYKTYRNYVLLRKSSARKLKKKIRYIEANAGKMQPSSIISSVMSYLGWLKHCDCHHLSSKYIYENNALRTIMDGAAEMTGIANPLNKCIDKLK